MSAGRGSFGWVGIAEGHHPPFRETIEEEVVWLTGRIDELQRNLAKLGSDTNEHLADQRTQLRALGQRLDEATSQLTVRLDEKEADAIKTDARALPVIGLGILLSGVPELFAWLHPIVLGALLIVALVGSLTLAVAANWKRKTIA